MENLNNNSEGNRSLELCRRVVTTESFIREAIEIYGDCYKYDKVEYKNKDHKVIVTCPIHGDFHVYAREHLDGKGCSKCEKGKRFIEKLKEKFNNKFGLDNFIYQSSTIPVTLICPTHGAFTRLPHSILNSRYGCPECGNEFARQLQEDAHKESLKRKEDETQRQIEANRKAQEEEKYCWRKIQKILNNDTYSKYDIKNLPKSFVGIDFETLYPQRVSVCSVGMVKYIDGNIVDRLYTLIRPPFDYPGKCGHALTWIHGLTEDMLKDADTFEEVLPQIESFVDGLPLVAHNACVEMACIRDASAFYEIDTKLDFENIYDTLTLSRQAEAEVGITVEGPGTHQLDTVCKRFGISGNSHHNALADAEMCGNLMVLFQKILCEGKTVEITETPTTPRHKYNSEDRVQRKDLENVCDNPFKNQIVVLTGFAISDSQEYAHKLNELGAIIKDSVNKKTNILITGYNAGPSKMRKAKEFGVRIISEEEYKEIIKQL